MTRIWTEGFEGGDALGLTAFTGTIATDAPRSGVYYANCFGYNKSIQKTLASGLSEFYLRFAWKTNQDSKPFAWRRGDTVIGQVMFNTATRRFDLYAGGAVVASATSILDPGQWVLFEVHLKIANSGGVLEWKLEGVDQPSFSGDTQPSTQTTVDNFFGAGLTASQLGGFDDFALNSTDNSDGLNNNSWCGDGHIIALKPNGNGDASQLTGSDGNSVDNYALVDDIPSNGDTDYVEGSTADERDLYNLTASGLTGATIQRVWVESRSRDTVAAGGTVRLGLKAGTTEDFTTPDTALLTTYTQIKSKEYQTNPADNAAWEAADLDSLQAGVKTRT